MVDGDFRIPFPLLLKPFVELGVVVVVVLLALVLLSKEANIVDVEESGVVIDE
jgi:hypothetical protein